METKVPGTYRVLDTVYHYDCLIKTDVCGDEMVHTLRKLSVASFRFFIV